MGNAGVGRAGGKTPAGRLWKWRRWRDPGRSAGSPPRPPTWLHRWRIAMVAAVMMCATVPATVAHAATLLTVAIAPVTTPVNSGDVVSYVLNVQCSNPTGCGTITATIPAPPGWSSAAGTPSASLSPAQIAAGITASVDPTSGALTLTWPNAAAGNSQQIQINWPTLNYLTAPGPQTVTANASDTAGDTAAPASATVDLNAVPNPQIGKGGPSVAVPGGTVSYIITASNIQTNPTTAQGGLALENAVVSDQLPAGVTFVGCDGCTYDPATNTATWPAIPEFAGQTVNHQLQYTLPAGAAPGDAFTDTATLTGTPFGSTTPVTVTGQATTTIATGPPVLTATTRKDAGYGVATPGGQLTWNITSGNDGNIDGTLVMSDDIPAGFVATDIAGISNAGTGAQPPSPTTILVTYSDGSQETFTWTGVRFGFTKPGVSVTNVTITIPDVGPTTSYGIILNGSADVNAAPGMVIQNCQTTTLTAPGVTTDSSTACATATIREFISDAFLTKSLISPTPAAPEADVTWALTINYDPSLANTPLQPQLIDLIPPQLTYQAGTFALATGQPADCPVGSDFGVTLVPNYLNGRTALIATTAASGATVPIGDTCTYVFNTTVNPGTPAGIYGGTASGAPPTAITYPIQPDYQGNAAYLFDTRGYMLAADFGKTNDAADVNQNGNTQEGVSAATADFAVARSAALGVTKQVMGDKDTNFLGSAEQDPTQVGTSTVGGTVTYRVTISDEGNEPMTNLVAYDLLPYPNNTGVTTSRYADHSDVNEWIPTLTGPINTGSDPVTVYYSTNPDPCRPEMDSTASEPFYCGGAFNANGDWTTASGVTDFSAVRAIRFDYGSTVIAPGSSFSYTWTMNVPTTTAAGTAFVGGERTWNKIAAQAASDVSGVLTNLLPTEAPWVVDQVVPAQEPASLAILKQADTPGPFHVGDTVPYTYTVTNTGGSQISNITVADDHVTSVTCDSTTLAPGASTLCHGTYVVTAADVTAGHVTNTAVANGTDPQGQPVQSPPAEVTVPVLGQAQLTIQKTADSAGPFHVGDTVSYTYTVTNPGTAAVSNITVTDDHVTSVTCDSTTLAPGASTLCHGTYVVTAADVTAGHVTNTAVANGTDPQGQPVQSPPAEATVPVAGEAQLTIQKTADSAGPFHVGDTVSYTYTVTNPGTAAVSNITVTDDHVASVTCDSTTLAPGASTLCHGTYVVTAADVTAGHVTNTAVANGTDPQGQPVQSPPGEATVPVVGEAALAIQKTADSAGPFHVGDTVSYTYTVTNTGTAAVTNVSVTDDHVTSVTCDSTTLAPGANTLCHGTYVVTAADVTAGHVTNTAVANGTDPQGQPVQSPPAEVTVPVVGEAQLSIQKAADSAGPFHVGDTVSYTYTVTNPGTAAVSNITVTDDHVTSVTCDSTTLAPGASTLCHGTYVVTAADVAAGHVTNTAVANGTDPQGQPVQSPPAEVTVPVAGEAALSIQKAADSAGPFHVGDTVSYTYTVTNTGTAVVSNITVSDDHVASVTCSQTTLNPGASTLCHGTYVVTAADVTAGHVTNTAVANGTDPQGQPVQSPPAEVTVPVAGEAQLSIQKAADSAGPFHVGDTVSYTYTVTNTGTAVVSNITVSDDHVASVTCSQTTLNPGASTLCHGTYVVTAADVTAGHVTNTAVANGTDPQGQPVQSPPAEVTVPVAGEAQLSIQKAADSAGPFHVGDTVSYTYTVTNTGTAAVTNVSVTDDHVTSVACVSTTLAPGASTLCHGMYVVTAADVTAGHVTNTAVANGTDPQGQPVQSPPAEATVPVAGEAALSIEKAADSAGPFHVGDTVSYTYTVTNTGTAVVSNITVSDDHVSSVTCSQTSLNPGASTLCHGTYVVTAADVTAGHVTNTAVANGTDPQGQPVQSPPAEVTVPVAGEAQLSIQKAADSAGPFHVGDTVSYTYTVTNTGTAAVTNVSVTDDHVASVTCSQTSLNPGASTLCHGSYVVTAADVAVGHVTNTAVANGTDPQGQPVQSPPAEATVPVAGEAQLSIQKAADSAGPFHVGDTVNYTYTVTNTGTAVVSNITVSDDHVTSVTCSQTSLNPGASTLCHGSYVVTAADVAAGHVTNTAVANGTDPQGQPVQSPPAEATVPVAGEAALSIQKAADSAGPFHVGDTVNYTYTVTNTGTAVITNVSVTDDHVTSVSCSTTTLNPGASTLCHGSYVVTAADVTAGHVTNTAHANGTDPQGQPVQSPPGEATVPVAGVAALSIQKAADSAGPFHVGDTVNYTYTVANTGTAVVSNVTVTDDHVTSVTCDATSLNPGQSTTCHGTYVITAADVQAGHVMNTAHASGTGPDGQPVQSPPGEVDVPVVGVAQLSIVKKADAAGPFRVGETVNYTYTVTNTGTAAVSSVVVSDDRVASVTCGAMSLNPGQSTTCHGSYTITEEDVQAGHVTNTARASGTDPEGRPVESAPGEATVETTSSASSLSITKQADVKGSARVGDTVTYTYTVTNTGATVLTDVTVRDDRVASVVCEATTLNPGESTTCRGTYTVTEEDAKAGHVTNTATASARGPQGQVVESAPVELCVTVSACPEKEECGKPQRPSEPPHGGGKGHLPDTGSPEFVMVAGLAGGGLLTVGGVLLYRARRRSQEEADRFVG
ncbi:hypothetical protein ACIQF6_00185 [Kitasatospora sp. NPDC092948]|uniref:DUF7507 domain-containing protein n=1 Tax=Kitasatospora sp. NPDC092948 TaxID=3364088 RepID=UPI003825FB41